MKISKLKKNKIYENDIKKIKEKLNKVNSNARPKSKKSMAGYVKTLLKKSDMEIEKIIEEMFIQKIIYEENKILKYNF